MDCPVITGVAIRIDGHVFSAGRPARHHNLLWDASLFGLRAGDTGDQGFVLADGRYVDRIEAARIALETGQVTSLMAPPRLYSEDLW